MAAGSFDWRYLGHYVRHIANRGFLVAISTTVVFATIAVVFGPGRTHDGASLPPIWFFLFAVPFAVLVWWHDQRPCLVCAAKMPKDLPAKAARWAWTFRVYHWPLRTWPRFLTAISLLAVLVVGETLFLLGQISGRFGSSFGVVFIAGVLGGEFVGLIHGRMKPWCKQCGDDGDGGDEIADPVPDPDPAGRATI